MNFMTRPGCNKSASQCYTDVINKRKLVDYFCSDTVFNLSLLQSIIDVPPATNFLFGYQDILITSPNC